ncbi:STAS domain-containing protein [Allonocardiopsis opalescens]|uniref:Anti-sigma factor antagonist n=1 Tax=Allonocardiopsis opalescens TaxID=1144618 RepID=A0A2T0Q742_9ACTN|nr:STAS domain-containing protein [Allonocardiopsis opalescens]PRX99614.1 anti-sigma B factor antagonist [Allonocardiopsis opalescens]
MVPDVELKVSSQYRADHALVTVNGEIDLYTAPQLNRELADAISGSPHLVVDLAQVDFCDSTGMNVLLAAMKRSRERGGSFVLLAPRPAVRKILQVTGLDGVFSVYDSLDDLPAAARAT